MYGEAFRRAWELYLAGSQAAFATGWMQLFQVVLVLRESPPPAWTRADVYNKPTYPIGFAASRPPADNQP